MKGDSVLFHIQFLQERWQTFIKLRV